MPSASRPPIARDLGPKVDGTLDRTRPRCDAIRRPARHRMTAANLDRPLAGRVPARV